MQNQKYAAILAIDSILQKGQAELTDEDIHIMDNLCITYRRCTAKMPRAQEENFLRVIHELAKDVDPTNAKTDGEFERFLRERKDGESDV